jgi:hypothetical protein
MLDLIPQLDTARPPATSHIAEHQNAVNRLKGTQVPASERCVPARTFVWIISERVD